MIDPTRPLTTPHSPTPAAHPSTPPAHTTPKPSTPPQVASGFTGGQQGAYDLLSSTLRSWGLDTLLPDLKGFIIAGDTSPDTLSLKLTQTKAYQERFAGNAIRKKNGLGELNPAQYIALEEQYNNVLRAYGLPSGFYDSQKDFTDYIGKNLSPDELKTRAQVAHDQYEAAPSYMKELWGQYYGSKGDMIAQILDPNVATQVIADRGQQVAIGGAAAQQGLGINQQRAQQFQQAGVSLEGARQAYRQIASSMPTDQSIAQRFGQQFSQQDEENDLLLGNADAANRRRSLYSSEEALFHGSSGVDANSLGVSQSAP